MKTGKEKPSAVKIGKKHVKTPLASTPPKNRKVVSDPVAFSTVRRGMKKIGATFVFHDLSSKVKSDDLDKVAGELAAHFFPLSARKKLYTFEHVHELYRIYLLLAPMTNQVQGYWRSWWTRDSLVSWLRTYVHKFKNTHLGIVRWDWEGVDINSCLHAVGVKDSDFIGLAQAYFPDVFGKIARSELARLAFGHIAFRREASDLLTVCRRVGAGLRWWEDCALILADRPVKEIPNATWVDLRRGNADVLDYSISAPNGLLHIKMNEASIKALKYRAGSVLRSKIEPRSKFHRVNDLIYQFWQHARYAGGAIDQVRRLEPALFKMLNKGVSFQTVPGLKKKYFNLREQRFDLDFFYPKNNYLFDESVEHERWMLAWAPRR